MIRHLSIKNYALIEELDIELFDGFTTITGETGAGKSILLGALGLILGQRADTAVLLDKDKKCVVEGTFSVEQFHIKELFERNDLDYSSQTILRREINPGGNSRAFVNDTPVNLAVLKELGQHLVDIHSQHQTLFLQNSSFQTDLLDAVAGIVKDAGNYRSDYRKFLESSALLTQWEEKQKSALQEDDYLRFQLNELEDARIEEGEQESLEQELDILNNAENINRIISSCLSGLEGEERSILPALNEVKNLAGQVSEFDPKLAELAERLKSSYLELKDAAADLDRMKDKFEFDAGRLEFVNDRLSLLYRLQKKHGVSGVAELLAIKKDLEERTGAFENIEEKITRLRKETEQLRSSLIKNAQHLSAERTKAARGLEKEVTGILAQLSMPNAAFSVSLKPLQEPGPSGMDATDFLFSANAGIPPRELGKVASGGELSRLMLALKSILARKKSLPTLIFDEIDTGVSGDVAGKLGKIMLEMSGQMQVFSITHLPQVASMGKNHLFVFKTPKAARTTSNLRYLSKEERIAEVAKMLSTENPTEAAIRNAKELLQIADV